MVKKLWKKWCKKVDEHNEKQNYVTQEECWEYYDIFLPFLFSIIITAILCIFLYIDRKYFSISFALLSFIIISIVIGIFQLINWFLFD